MTEPSLRANAVRKGTRHLEVPDSVRGEPLGCSPSVRYDLSSRQLTLETSRHVPSCPSPSSHSKFECCSLEYPSRL